jgi:hypothetical protein
MKLKKLTRQQEKQVLASMLVSLDGEIPNNVGSRLKREALLGLCLLFLAAAWAPALLGATPLKVYLAASGTVAGGFFMFVNWRFTAVMQWPAIARCLDREKIEARLRELDA